jgi:hypothetical protein
VGRGHGTDAHADRGASATGGGCGVGWWRQPLGSRAAGERRVSLLRYLPAGADRDAALGAGRLLYYREGAMGTVSVKALTGDRSLAIDGKVDASTARDMLTQKALAHLPLLLHPNPRTAAVVGLGSGVTLGAALVHPLESADVVEISPEVVAASRFFDAENRRALDDPRAHLVAGDGRSHLALTRQRYDVVISEPSNPWMAGVAALFTDTFFRTVRDRLTPGGIFCQWAHTYDINDADLRSIVATFRSVFPEGTMWLVADGDLLLVGSTASLEPRSGRDRGRVDQAGRGRRPSRGRRQRAVRAAVALRRRSRRRWRDTRRARPSRPMTGWLSNSPPRWRCSPGHAPRTPRCCERSSTTPIVRRPLEAAFAHATGATGATAAR